jgi:hypothetical protein
MQTTFSHHKLIRYGGFAGKENIESKSYIVADSEITYQCSMKEKNYGRQAESAHQGFNGECLYR